MPDSTPLNVTCVQWIVAADKPCGATVDSWVHDTDRLTHLSHPFVMPAIHAQAESETPDAS